MLQGCLVRGLFFVVVDVKKNNKKICSKENAMLILPGKTLLYRKRGNLPPATPVFKDLLQVHLGMMRGEKKISAAFHFKKRIEEPTFFSTKNPVSS